MTATGGTTPKPTFTERFARAASTFLDKRVLILLGVQDPLKGPPTVAAGLADRVSKMETYKDDRIADHAPLTPESGHQSPQREFPLG